MSAKFRSFLSVLGIVIGVASVIIIFATGLSAQELILSQIKGIGSNLVAVLPGASDEDGPPAAVFGISVTTLTNDDLKAITSEKEVPEVEAGAGYVQGTATVESRDEEISATFIGTSADFIEVENADVEDGRFFTEEEESGLARMAVIGNEVAENLFGEDDPINKKIKIKDQNFMVIGVLEEKGSVAFGMSSQDTSVYVPLKTAQKLLLGINHLGYIRLKVKEASLIDLAIANIKEVLRDSHDIDDPANDDFSVRNQAADVESLGMVTDALRYFLLAIGSLSLVVGGIGIMNIMLIAVNQRIREVGLRKAVGAKNDDVMTQFLIESAFVSFVGGMIGIIFGVLVSFLISVIVNAIGYEWQFLISLNSILIAISVSIAIGLIFGVYPARKAAKVSPMEALRYE